MQRNPLLSTSIFVTPSPDLSEFLGTRKGESLTRPDVVRKVWKYVQDQNLFEKDNNVNIIPDKKMARLFGSGEIYINGSIFLAEMMKVHLK